MKETYINLPVPTTIALLSDSHNMVPDPVFRSLEKHRPGMILMAGDIICGEKGEEDGHILQRQKNVLPLLEFCANKAPTFLSWGNHDRCLGPEDIKQIEKTKIHVLDNSYVSVLVNDQPVVIGGLTSAWITDYRERSKKTGIPVYMLKKKGKDPIVPKYDWLKEYTAIPGYHILLSHHPEYLRYIPKEVELVVSGHAHGGQWQFFNRGLFAPGQGLFAKMISGVIDNRMVLSRGLSNPSRIPRINNPTEIIYIVNR